MTAEGDVLLWSHYGDQGRGIRILFDIPIQARNFSIERITYSDEIPSLALNLSTEDIKYSLLAVVDKASRTKGKAWQYENEVRLSLWLNKQSSPIEVGFGGNVFWAVDSSMIKGVDFGSKVSWELARRTVLLLKRDSELANICFRKALPHPRKYRYGYEDVDVSGLMVD